MTNVVTAVAIAIVVFVLLTFVAAKIFFPLLVIAAIALGVWLWLK